MMEQRAHFPPMSKKEMIELGWDRPDFILVSGDAYIDHPSFGSAIIVRILENSGFKVAVIAQPDWRSLEDFKRFGRPRLGFLVNSGNIDSMVNHYTAAKKPRSSDVYTPGAAAGKRPDRAVIVYCNKIREAFRKMPIVIGGVEASLRRFAHYDYWDDKVRRGILIDSGADLLIYGMGEKPIVEIARALDAGIAIGDIDFVRGTAFVRENTPEMRAYLDRTDTKENLKRDERVELDDFERASNDKKAHIKANIDRSAVIGNFELDASVEQDDAGRVSNDKKADAKSNNELIDAIETLELDSSVELDDFDRVSNDKKAHIKANADRSAAIENIKLDACMELDDFERVSSDKKAYAEAYLLQKEQSDAMRDIRLLQAHGRQLLCVNPPQIPLSRKELDRVYALPFARLPHPSYDQHIPALDEVEFSITSCRACFGSCSFCALTYHQGRAVNSRSHESIISEAVEMTKSKRFKGYIHDVGGPTANFRQPACDLQKKGKSCSHRQCLFPKPCKNLRVDHSEYTQLLRKLRALPKIKKVFVRSGLRYDYVLHDAPKRGSEFLTELIEHHISGQLKIAPEHINDNVLKVMGKPSMEVFERFVQKYRAINENLGKEQYIVPYFMSSHPGSDLNAAIELACYMKEKRIRPEQVQDFYPTPATLSTTIYYTGFDPRNGERVFVPKSSAEKRMQRALLQYFRPENARIIREALKLAGREDLIGYSSDSLVRPEREANYAYDYNSRNRGAKDEKQRSAIRDKKRSTVKKNKAQSSDIRDEKQGSKNARSKNNVSATGRSAKSVPSGSNSTKKWTDSERSANGRKGRKSKSGGNYRNDRNPKSGGNDRKLRNAESGDKGKRH